MQALAPTAARAASRVVSCSRALRSRPCGIPKAHQANSSRLYSHRRQLLGALVGAPVLAAGGGLLRAAPAAAAAVGSDADAIAKVLEDPNWPEAWPFRPEDFLRYDEADDAAFYSAPRFVYHIDDGAVAALTNYYEEVFPPAGAADAAVLDICSSWVSHYPKGWTAGRVAGLGMVAEELKANPALTEWAVHDLNKDPKLPYADNSFDVVTNCVSVDYLNRPLEVFKEVHRVLKPGGRAVMSFSNRCFPTKAIALWTATGDADHVWIVGAYFHYSVPGGFAPPEARDISPKRGGAGALLPFGGGGGDPMYVVTATKLAA